MSDHRICVAAKWDLHESIGQPWHFYSFRKINGRPAAVLGEYASCDKDPPTLCAITAYWNGKEFAQHAP